VGEQHRAYRGVVDVFIGDACHVDGETGGNERALAQNDFTAGEVDGAVVVIELISGIPEAAVCQMAG
jgi:hypothetical protein